MVEFEAMDIEEPEPEDIGMSMIADVRGREGEREWSDTQRERQLRLVTLDRYRGLGLPSYTHRMSRLLLAPRKRETERVLEKGESSITSSEHV
jgi:hypothetical protein